MFSDLWLAAGVLLAFIGYLVKGRILGLCVTALWGLAAAYFFMEPAYSLRVAGGHDLAALVLYGTVGIALARTSDGKRRPACARKTPEVHRDTVDLKSVWHDPAFGLEARLQWRLIQIETTRLEDFRCSRAEAELILSSAIAAALSEPELRRVCLSTARRAGTQMLFVDVQRIWPPPLHERVSVGCAETVCSPAPFHGWPPHLTGTWFENGCGRTYQVTLRRDAPPCEITETGSLAGKIHSPDVRPAGA